MFAVILHPTNIKALVTQTLLNIMATKSINYPVLFLILINIFTGCASVKGPTDPHDPFEGYNRAVYEFNEDFDKAIAEPVAKFYDKVVPNPVDKGVTNFFSNINDVRVLANNLLQLKFAQAAHDAARIFFNTTIGLVGIFDVASHMDFPKHHEDFGQTLAFWGVPKGPYFVLPFLGPSTIRDSIGLGTDYAYFDPIFNRVDKTATQNFLFALDFLDTRADLLGASRLLGIAALDPYVFTREAYLQKRRYLIYDGDPPPLEDFESPDEYQE